MEDNSKITKIVVSSEDELTDVVSAIISAQTERIILTFAEPSDILISPINLSVIKETAQDAEKIIICQIIKNSTGIRNANLAKITTIDTPNNPTEDIWDSARNAEEEVPVVEKQSEALHPSLNSTNPSDFEKRINEAILKSRNETEKKKENKTIREDGLLISVDEDLPTDEPEEIPVDLSKVDFKDISVDKGIQPQKVRKHFNWSTLFSFLKKPQMYSENVPPSRRKIKRLALIFTISLVFIAALVGFIYFNTGPFVKIRIFVKAQSVSIEKTFTGDANINAIDFENLKIPIKTDSVEESRSTTITATGTSYEGTKATGSIVLSHSCPGSEADLSLPAGLVATSSDGKTYTLDSATTVPCNSSTLVTAKVTATDIGEEYNTPNSYFTLAGYTSSDVIAYKSGDFTGGTKTQYTVLSTSDVNTAKDSLVKSAKTDAEDELKSKTGEWTIIESSIKSEVEDDSVKTDVAVGAHASQANLSLTVKSSATFYLNTGFDDGVASLLTAEAQAQNLFQSDQNIELELGEDITKEVSVVQSNDKGVLIKLVATGSVQPKIDKAKIIEDLHGMKWDAGATYLDNIKYSDKATVYEFNPSNFPKFLYYFPKRQGGIIIDVVDI